MSEADKMKHVVGYTEGFNDGLVNKPNIHEMPEEEWVPVEKTNPRNTGKQRVPGKTVNYHDPEIEKVMLNSYKIGYNWGYKHGIEKRQDLSLRFNAVDLNRITNEFSTVFRIIYLEINENYTPFFVLLNPDIERKHRTEFIENFLNKSEIIKPDKAKLNEIKEYIDGNRLQRAIDHSIDYFKEQKHLTNYYESLVLKSRQRNLRHKISGGNLDKEESENEKKQITESIVGIINKELLSLK